MDTFQMATNHIKKSAIIFDEYDDAKDDADTSVCLHKNHGFGPIPKKRQKQAAMSLSAFPSSSWYIHRVLKGDPISISQPKF